MPTELAIQENAWVLARQAIISQANGLVPIVELEILADGTHDIEVSASVTERVLAACVKNLHDNKFFREGGLLKPNMITPGFQNPDFKDRKAMVGQVAWYTVRTLRRTMPPALPGINFLSGGFSEEEATLFLNAMNKIKEKMRTRNLSFSYGRALQSSTLKAWKGNDNNIKAAQDTFIKVAEANGKAQVGTYEGGALESQSLCVANYVY